MALFNTAKGQSEPLLSGQTQPSSQPTLLVLLAAGLITLPHGFHLPASIFLFFVGLVGYRLITTSKPEFFPKKWILLLCSVGGLGLLVAEHRTVIGLYAGTSFLVIALALKILEMKNVRDCYVVVFLSFFVAVTQFLYSQTILMAGYLVISAGLLVTTLICLTTGTMLTFKNRIKLAGKLLLHAFPLMILLFFLFPRLPSPRIGLPINSSTARTGLSDSMQPGQISQLVQSSEVAFRVNFSGELPPARDRYWRGPVFWQTDGIGWSVGDQVPGMRPQIAFRGKQFRYEITLEPHRRNWLFALDLPANLPPRSRQTPALLLLSEKNIRERISYSLVSFTRYNTGPIEERQRQWGLQLPRIYSPQINELVHSWQRTGEPAQAIVDKALEYFHSEPFFYTLSPPTYPHDPIASFLFGAKRGFCEHFAGAFVFLMRVANIPARVVTGYQGGEVNNVGGFLEVRQSDAHAWAEVWLANRGWVRVDPTAAVAPERIERGIDAISASQNSGFSLNRLNLVGSGEMLQKLRFAWSALDHAWHRWIISYNAASQNDILNKIGLTNLQSIVFALFCGIAVCMAISAYWILQTKNPDLDRALELYLIFSRKLAKAGLEKRSNEGARDFACRAILQYPDLRAEILRITDLYHKIRYGIQHSEGDLNQLTRSVHAFRNRRLAKMKKAS